MSETVLAWWWSDGKLRYNDGRFAKVGITHTVEGKPETCEHGLHGSERILDALQYSESTRVWRVELSGEMDADSDKIAAQSRRYLWTIEASEVLPAFARRVALDVIDLWDAPDVVRQYLETGDQALRDAAWNQMKVWDAAWDAAQSAWDAVRYAVRCAVYDTWQARSVVRAARSAAASLALREAWSASAWDKYSGWLEEMIAEVRDE